MNAAERPNRTAEALARELDTALRETSEFRCAERTARALADGQAALARARE